MTSTVGIVVTFTVAAVLGGAIAAAVALSVTGGDDATPSADSAELRFRSADSPVEIVQASLAILAAEFSYQGTVHPE